MEEIIYLHKALAKKIEKGEYKKLSFDLGKSYKNYDPALLKKIIPKDVLRKIKGNAVYLFNTKTKQLAKLAIFDDSYYSLSFVNNQPILEINGIRMHVFSFGNVFDYAKSVARSIKIKKGAYVLETCFGFGYITKELIKKARVVAIEKNKAVIELAKLNPWSKDIFFNKNFKLIEGDAYEVITKINKRFDVIIHDPPTFNIAPLLYSYEFYKRLRDVIKDNGLLYHYTGNPGKLKGKKILEGIKNRLDKAGWNIIKYDNKMMALWAKPKDN